MSQATGRASFARCLLVLLTATAAVVALAAKLLPDVLALGAAIRSGAVAGEPFDEVLVRGCEVALAGCAAWLWLATVVVTRDAAHGRTPWPRGVPRAWRRLVLAACGVALVGALGAPAHAGDLAGTSPVEGLPLPDRATTTTYVSQVFARASSRQERSGTPSRRQPDVVVVRTGDTLWTIARAGLPADADDGAVAVRVREIHQANLAVIGTDPDLIRPDQRLRMPQSTTIREEHR
ncbi:MAG: LysM peptidoglycan-binding domain-containing protein [Nocardioides sp.]